MRAARTNVNFRPSKFGFSPNGQGLGQAAGLLHLIKRNAPVTFFITNRCNLRCEHCYVTTDARPIDMPAELLTATVDELRNIDRAYFSGIGEPSRYMAGTRGHEQLFLDLVHYTARQVGTLFIDTNGSFLPSDPDAARTHLSQFPKNVGFILSLDIHHATALANRGKSLSKIFYTLLEACEYHNIRLEVNVRRATSDETAADIAQQIGINPALEATRHLFNTPTRYQLGTPYELAPYAHLNSTLAQGRARDLSPHHNTKPVGLSDFLSHIHTIKEVGLFITPDGLVVSGDHAATCANPPALCVAGNLHEETLASILWNTFFRYYQTRSKERDHTFESLETPSFFESEWPFEARDMASIGRRLAHSQIPTLPPRKIVSMVLDPTSPIDFEIDFRLKDVYRDYNQTTEAENKLRREFMRRRKTKRAIAQAAQDFATELIEDDSDWFLTNDHICRIVFKPYTQKGKLIFSPKPITYAADYHNIEWLAGKWPTLTDPLQRQAKVFILRTLCSFSEMYGTSNCHEFFALPLREQLAARLHSVEDGPAQQIILAYIETIDEEND